MKKFIKKPSTWVIIVIACLAVFLINGVLIFKLNVNYKTITKTGYIIVIMAVYSEMATFFALFSAIFSGFLGSKVIRDEIEDGTFLILLSKPITRIRIIIEKWLAFITMIVTFIFLMTLSLVFAALIFDKPIKSNGAIISIATRNNLNRVFWIIFGIGLVISFIFSSLALIISTKASTGATIGIVSAMGIAIPLTSLIGIFSTKESHDISFYNNENNSYKNFKNLLEIYGVKNENIIKTKIPIPGQKGKTIEINNVEDLALTTTMIYQGIIFTNFGDVALKSSSTANYDYLSYMDLNYQIRRLGIIGVNAIVPNSEIGAASARSFITNSAGQAQKAGIVASKQITVKTYSSGEISGIMEKTRKESITANFLLGSVIKNKPLAKERFSSLFNLSSFLNRKNLTTSAQKILTSDNYQMLMTKVMKEKTDSDKVKLIFDYLAQKQKVDKIKYEDFINKYAILWVYIVIAIVLIPITYFVVKNEDFS